MSVQRCGERARGHGVLDEGEALFGGVAADHESNPDAAEEAGRAVRGSQNPGGCRLHCHRHLISSDSSVAPTICVVELYVKIQRTGMPDQTRPYRMQRRADSQEQTRLRIIESAVELHGTVGPSRTSISSVAARAGVRRSTVYRHFPDEAALFDACTAHWSAANPPPDLNAWSAIENPDERLRAALNELYAFYRRTEPMLENLFRDEMTV